MATPTRLDFQPLLRVEFRSGGTDPATGLDCRGLCAEVLRRAGFVVPPSAFPTDEQVQERLPAWLAASAGRDGCPWQLLGRHAGCASQVGDVVYSCADGVHHHLDVLVSSERPKVFLEAFAPHGRRAGGVRAIALSRIRGVLGVYRLLQP